MYEYFHFGVDFVVKVEVFMFGLFDHVVVKLLVGNFVAFLKFSVVREVLLNCVIGEVDFTTISFQVVLRRGRSNVAVFVEVALDPAIDAGHHHVVSEVELTFLVEKRFLDVALDDVGFWAAV